MVQYAHAMPLQYSFTKALFRQLLLLCFIDVERPLEFRVKFNAMEQSSAFDQHESDDYRYPDDDVDEMTDLQLSPANTEDANNLGEHHDQLPSVEEVRANMYLDNPNDPRRHTTSPSNQSENSSRSQHSRQCHRRGIAIAATVLAIMAIAVVLARDKGDSRREDAALEYLLYHNISNPITLERRSEMLSMSFLTSPQQKALHWIVHDDPLQVDIPKVSSTITENDESTSSSPFLQRYIVGVFVYTLTTLGSKNENHKGYNDFWQKNLHFLSGLHECQWNSNWKRKDGSTLKMGFLCNDDMVITDIILQTLDLHGPLPLEIFHLQELSHLALDMNQISGDVPFLPSLTHLSLAYNQLGGMFGLLMWRRITLFTACVHQSLRLTLTYLSIHHFALPFLHMCYRDIALLLRVDDEAFPLATV